jgi:hypothetical protein
MPNRTTTGGETFSPPGVSHEASVNGEQPKPSKRKCTATKKDGTPCPGYALGDAWNMPHLCRGHARSNASDTGVKVARQDSSSLNQAVRGATARNTDTGRLKELYDEAEQATVELWWEVAGWPDVEEVWEGQLEELGDYEAQLHAAIAFPPSPFVEEGNPALPPFDAGRFRDAIEDLIRGLVQDSDQGYGGNWRGRLQRILDE